MNIFEDVTWTIVVENTGDVTLTDVTVSDPLAPDCDRTSTDIPALASMAPGDKVEYECTLQNVQNFLINIAEAEGTDPNEETVTDDDSSPISFTSAIAAIGDTVWFDEDGDGIEDPEEVGVPDVDVELYICNDPPDCTDTTFVGEETTDADGHYQFIELPVDNYIVIIDTGTIGEDGELTTPGQFVVPLADDELTEFLNADFGIEEVLPETGIDADRMGWYGLLMLSLGGIFLLGSGLRRREQE